MVAADSVKSTRCQEIIITVTLSPHENNWDSNEFA